MITKKNVFGYKETDIHSDKFDECPEITRERFDKLIKESGQDYADFHCQNCFEKFLIAGNQCKTQGFVKCPKCNSKYCIHCKTSKILH